MDYKNEQIDVFKQYARRVVIPALPYRVYASGYFGSLARNTFRATSDLDLVAISDKDRGPVGLTIKCDFPFRQFVRATVFCFTADTLWGIASGVDKVNWPLHAAALLDQRHLTGKRNLINKQKERFRIEHQLGTFHAGFNRLTAKWLHIAYENCDKLDSVSLSSSHSILATDKYLFSVANVIKAVNHDYFHDSTDFVQDIIQSQKKPGYAGPANCEELMLGCLRTQTTGLRNEYARRLLDAVTSICSSRGIRPLITDKQSIRSCLKVIYHGPNALHYS
jgi:hypothetical protein